MVFHKWIEAVSKKLLLWGLYLSFYLGVYVHSEHVRVAWPLLDMKLPSRFVTNGERAEAVLWRAGPLERRTSSSDCTGGVQGCKSIGLGQGTHD